MYSANPEELTRIVPRLVCAVLIVELEVEAGVVLVVPPAAAGDAGVVLDVLDAELPQAASPIAAAARTGAAHHRLRIVILHSLRCDPKTPYTSLGYAATG
jgi:hypothetical protein